MKAYPYTVMRCAMLFSVYTFARPGEVRAAEWSEIKGDVWDIPAGKMKMKRRHIVPLSAQVKAIIEELRPMTGEGPLVISDTEKQRALYGRRMESG